MRMKNEQRYRGIIQAQMKDLGVLLPKGLGDEEGREMWKKSERKKDYIKAFVYVPHLFLYFKYCNNLFFQLRYLIVNQYAILPCQQPRREHAQTSI